MFGNLHRLLKRIMDRFNKLHVGAQVVTLVVIALGIYYFISKKNFVSGNLLNALKIREGMAGKANNLTYYHMEGCPYCAKFDPVWEKVKEEVPSETCIKTCRKIDSKDSETGKNGVGGFPTIMLCDENNDKVAEFSGERSVDGIVAFCKENCA
jgi:hypothetical protein